MPLGDTEGLFVGDAGGVWERVCEDVILVESVMEGDSISDGLIVEEGLTEDV
jgi:hypothetical protein